MCSPFFPFPSFALPPPSLSLAQFFFASLCCLGLIFVISLISTVTVHSTINGISTESTTQAIAARQRMLAQQIAKSSGAIAVHAAFPEEMGTLADLRLELDTAEKGSRNSSTLLAHIPPTSCFSYTPHCPCRSFLEFEKQHVILRNDKVINSARVAQEFQGIDASYQIIKTKAISIIQLVPNDLLEIRLQSDRDTIALYAADCMKAANDFAPQMDTIVAHVQEEHDAILVSSLDDLLALTWAMLGAVFLAVIFEAVKVFKPMLARVALFASVALDSQVAVQATENDLSHKRNIARLFETASAPIFAIDNDFAVTSWNPQMVKITGMPEEEAIGQQLVSLVPEEAKETVFKLKTVSMEGGEAGLVELPVLNQNGAPKMLVISASPQRDMGSSKVEGLFCIAQDFTEHKAMEKARDTFLASFSHEIRTPLNGVLGMLQVLCEFDLPAQAMTYLRQACTSGNLLLNLINDILDLSKINAGQLEMSEAPFVISQTVKDAMSIVRPIATKKDLSLIFHIADAVPEMGIGDAMRLRQVILNLLSNAIKFTPEGAVTLRVGLHDVRDGKYVLRFEVEDTGVGMTAEGMEGLFQIFGKLKQTQVANTSGCGLGLSISKQLVALMGGDIEVSSVVGKGSKFSFTIAVERHDIKKSGSDSDTASKSSASKSGSGTGTGTGSGSGTVDLAQQLGDGLSTAKYKESLKACSTAHLLCAEDNLFNVEVLRAFVSGSSMTMTCVENGKLAYEAYISDPLSFDVILMDCQMPEMDGYEATRLIRQWERTHEKKLARRAAVPIVALTAYAMSLDRKKALDAGMDSFLTKPVSKYALVHTISEHVGGKVSGGQDDRASETNAHSKRALKAEKAKKTKQKEDKGKLAKLEMLHASVLPRDVMVAERAADTKTPNDIDDRSMVTDSVTNASSSTAVRRAKVKAKADWKSLPIVDQQAGLMQFGGSQQAHMEILDMFAKTFLPSCRSDIARHRADKNYSALSKTVHSLKGASGFAVASRIFTLAKDLQRIVPGTEKLSEGEEGAVARLLERLDDEFDKFMEHYMTINGTPLAAQRALATRSTLKSPDERRLDGVVVLYAEDNPFCVSVIRTYMQSCNATIVSANDGTDVVSKLVSARDKYDCVLMDCHMPVMDGFQALKVIRQWEGDQALDPIPIVGITAYAGHRDTMLEGGMTGFLTKPVSRPTLIRTIAACLDGRKAEQESETESVYDTADAAELGVLPEEGDGGGAEGAEGGGETASFVVDVPVDMKAGTANFGSEEQYLDLLQRFRSSFIPEATAGIHAALKARDADALSKAVHRLKGSAGYVGAGALFQVCSETRTAIAAKGATWRKSEQQATAVLAEVKRVLAFLERNDKVRAFFDADQKGAGEVAQSGDDASQDGSLSSLEMC